MQPTGPTRHRRAPSRKQPSAQVSSSSVMGTVSHSGEKSVFSVEGEFPKRELWAEGLGALDRGNWAGGLTAVFAGGRLHRQADPTPALPLRVRAGRCAWLPSRSFPAHGHMGAGPLQWGPPLTGHRSCPSSAHHTPRAEKHRRDRKPRQFHGELVFRPRALHSEPMV